MKINQYEFLKNMQYNKNKPTRAQTTEVSYLNRSKNLARRFRKEKQIPNKESIDYRHFVGWLIQNKKNWSRETWRQYKSSIIAYLETINEPIALEAKENLQDIESNGCVQKTKKTSGSKLKKFPVKDFYKLITHLENNNYKWSIPLKRWVMTGLITGLRPQEWAGSQMSVINNENALIVPNAKNTNGRSHGDYRTILLGMLEKEEINMIKEQVNRANQWKKAGQFQDFYKGCSGTLYRVCRKIWPNRKNHITLYSTRHQFSADAKASGLSREEIAALMGHAVDDTATLHYGRKVAGHDLLRVRAYAPEVKKIKKMVVEEKIPKPKQEPEPEPTFTPNNPRPTPYDDETNN